MDAAFARAVSGFWRSSAGGGLWPVRIWTLSGGAGFRDAKCRGQLDLMLDIIKSSWPRHFASRNPAPPLRVQIRTGHRPPPADDRQNPETARAKAASIPA